ncbi:MAG: bifunctional adenosylcobinamide kinase/adenosylcobinamide-phosphate guanylyltransferase [Desulfopila sp.]|nr:bifunctional adenosylcobinamide kinase/adenosylcobinamide-phosphate guanylyltransferase [Desulfopila sp.]
MSKIVLVTGGSRSGKSAYAQKRAEENGTGRLFIATCPKIDGEMDSRIERHQRDRQGKGWITLEEEIDLSAVIAKHKNSQVILVDCLTLWINNLVYQQEKKSIEMKITEERVVSLSRELLSVSRQHSGMIFFVTNEVGSGIVPDSSATRHFRDLVGRCNQIMAEGADEVVLVSCGIPLFLKKQHTGNVFP